MGEDLWDAREANPKGFFESQEINSINEDLLAQVIPRRPKLLGKLFFKNRPRQFQRWLATIPKDAKFSCTRELEKRIVTQVRREPYCFKDPRFSHTLPVWKPFLRNTIYLCVFREPQVTVKSIMRECREANYLNDFKISEKSVYRLWLDTYKNIIDRLSNDDSWLFVHYDQVLNGEAMGKISHTIEAEVDCDFAESKYKRTNSCETPSKVISDCYLHLCSLAGYRQ